MLFPVVLGLLRPGLLEEPLVYWSRKTYGPRLLRNLAPGVNSGSLRTSPKRVTFSPWRLDIWDCLALESYMSILTLYPLHKDDVFYLCCKLENTSQTHGSVRSPELIGRNSVVMIVQGLYICITRQHKPKMFKFTCKWNYKWLSHLKQHTNKIANYNYHCEIASPPGLATQYLW